MNELLNLYESVRKCGWPFLLLHAALLVLVILSMFRLHQYMQINHVWKSIYAKARNDIQMQRQIREAKYQRAMDERGQSENVPFLKKLDMSLKESGLKSRYIGLTAELFLLISMTLVLAIGLLTFLVTGAVIHAITAGMITAAAIVLYLYARKIRAFNKTEAELTKLINILENVSYSEPGIVEIIGKTAGYMNEPLRGNLEQCYYQMKTDGNIKAALQEVVEKTEHPKMKSLFESFIICYQHSENYNEIIETQRNAIRDYISARRERAAIRKNSFIELVIIGVMGIATLGLLTFLVNGVVEMIFGTLFGQVMVMLLVIILLFGVWGVIRIDK